jgi:hypothetical protein
MAFPIILSVFSVSSFALGQIFSFSFSNQRFTRRNQFNRKRFIGQLFSFFSFALITFYTFIISTAISPFECSKSEGDTGYTLIKAPSQRCFDVSWLAHLPLVVIFLLLYLVVFPVCFFLVFFRFRKNVSTSKFQSRFGALVSPYKTRTFYWELILLLKRIVFILSADLGTLLPSSQVKYFLMLSTLCVFFIFEAFVEPYTSDSRNRISVS